MPDKLPNGARKIDYAASREEREKMTGFLRAGGIRQLDTGSPAPNTPEDRRRVIFHALVWTMIAIGLFFALF